MESIEQDIVAPRAAKTPASKLSDTPKAKTARQIPSSLLRSTAATAAKSRNSSLTRTTVKRGSGTPRSMVPKTETKKTPYGTSFVRQGLSGKPSSTLKVKKVAVSSFIADEESGKVENGAVNLPDQHDWDASAIGPRVLHVSTSSVSSDCTTMSSKGNCSVLVSSNTEVKVPKMLKSQVLLGNKKAVSKRMTVNGPLKVIHPSNNDSTSVTVDDSFDQEEEAAADDYLISELIKMNAQESLQQVTEAVNNDVVAIWSALEKLRFEGIQNRSKNSELRQMLDFVCSYSKIKDDLELAVARFPKEKLRQLREGVEHCRNNLKVKGVHLANGIDYESQITDAIKENLKDLSPHLNTLAMSDEVSRMDATLCETLDAFNRCKVASEEVNHKRNQLTSLQYQISSEDFGSIRIISTTD